MKLIHTADWHIDANLTEAGNCLQFLVDQANEIQPDLTVISGDMFNSADVRLDSEAARLAMRTVTALKDYSKHGVVILIGTPSHDGLAAKIFNGIPKVMVEDKPRSIIFDTIDEGYKNFVVSCLPQPTKQYLESVIEGDIEDLNQAMSVKLTAICSGFAAAHANHPDGPHICLGHFSVKGAMISPTQQMMGYDIELSTFQLNSAHPTLWCLGHIHRSQEVAPGILYSGSLYRVDFGERESIPGFWVHNIISAQQTADKAPPDPENLGIGQAGLKWLHDVQSVFHETPASSMSKKGYDVTGGLDDPDEIYNDKVEIADKMQVEIKCYADQIDVLDYHIIKENLIARGAKEVDVIVQRIPRPNIRSAKILAVENLRDKLIARAELTDDEVKPGVLEKADLIETMTAEAVLTLVKQRFQKGDSE